MATEINGLIYSSDDSLKANAVTVTASYGNTLQASNYGSNVVTIATASTRKAGINITGNAKNNVIIGGVGADTLGGGAGNDTLTGGKGNDLFVYTAGNDVITDYGTGNDTIKISATATYSISSSDVVFKVGSNTLKVKGAKTSAVTVADSKNSLTTYQNGLIYDGASSVSATSLTVTSFYGNKLAESSYGSNVVTITAASRTKAINITGNSQDNYIVGSTGNDTIGGGKGNDTLTGGNGKDIFVYTAGNDYITDFTAGQDTIRATVGAVASYSISGSDAVFQIGKIGSITVKNGKSNAITLMDSGKKALTYQNSIIYNNATVAKSTAITITSGAANTLGSSDYGSNVVSVDASARTNALQFTGNTKANKIIGGSGNDTLDGAKGNDTLTGGAGEDVFVYSNGEGNDVIADYVAGEDVIKISSGTITSYAVKSSDLVLKVGSGSIKVKGAKAAAVTVIDADSVTTTYQAGLIFDGSNTTKASAVTVTSNYGNTLSSYSANIVSINAAGHSNAMKIVGNTKNNYIAGTEKNDTIDGGSGSDTIEGGKGNDILTGGSGKDVFIYNSGDGNDTITDYTMGEDTLKVVGASIGTYTVSGNNAIIKVGSGNITLKDVGEKEIVIADAEDHARVYRNGLIYGGTSVARAKSLTVTSAYTGDLASYGANVVSIDASARTSAIELVGNAGNNYIAGGTKADTIEGGDGDDTIVGNKGNDTLTGGAGNDVFIYDSGDGSDVITDYTSGEDIISLAGDYPVVYSVSGSDAILNVGKSNLTLQGVGTAPVTVVANDVASVCSNGAIKLVNDPSVIILPTDLLFDTTTDTLNASAVTITSDYSLPSFNASKYTSLSAIYADGRDAISITGNALDNLIYGGAGDGSLNGGTGDDTLKGAKGNYTLTGGNGNDVFIYESNSDYHVITDYTTGDDIVSINSSITSGAVSGNDVLFTIGDGILKLKNAKDKRVSIRSGNSITEYMNGEIFEDLPDMEGLTITLAPSFNGDFSLSSYNEILNEPMMNINASLTTSRNTLRGDENNNFIWVGTSGSRVYTGAGDDYVYAGDGNDTICIYDNEGNDAIYNYKTGDCVYLATDAEQFKNISVNTSDIIINMQTGEAVTLKGAREQRIYIYDYQAEGSTTYRNTFGKITMDGDSVTLDSDYSGTFDPSFYDTSIVDIDASGVRNVIAVYGTSNTNVISSGDIGISIYSGAGNDTIYSGNGNDTIQYTSGNDVIYNYKSGDFINFGTNSVNYQFSYVSFSDNDIILNMKGSNKITLKDAISQKVHIRGNNPDAFDINSTFGLVTFSDTTAILAADYSGTFNTSHYSNSILDIDASAVVDGAQIYGNSQANVITLGSAYNYVYAGAGNDTIYSGSGGSFVEGGTGNDFISLGGGSNVIRHYTGDGNDTVYGFSGSDQIYLATASPQFSGVSLTDNDIIINMANGNTITLMDARYANIRITDTQEDERYASYAATFGNVVIDNLAVILNANYSGEFNLAYYDSSRPSDIDAQSVTSAINIVGDDRDNKIYAGIAGGTINGGSGNDTIYCGAGVDSIEYYADGGSDVIRDIGDNDRIYLNNSQTSSVTVVDSNIIITSVSEKTVTIVDGANKTFYINDSVWSDYALNYADTETEETLESSADIIDDFWFTDDNNFISANNLDAIMDDGAALTGLNFNDKDIFAQDEPQITYVSNDTK